MGRHIGRPVRDNDDKNVGAEQCLRPKGYCMKIIIQRVKQAQVDVDGKTVGQIGGGVLVFLGVAQNDTQDDADYLVRKVSELRMFEDDEGKMNLSALDKKSEFLIISQFTLYGNCDKGRRPSFNDAAKPDIAIPLYEYFVKQLRGLDVKVETGEFQAMMDVKLVNDGPVTFIIESKRDK